MNKQKEDSLNDNASARAQTNAPTLREGTGDSEQSQSLENASGSVSGAQTAQASALDMIRELRGTKCRCGAEKKSGFTFCYSCFKSLPPAYQKALYQRMGSGYEEAYGAAFRFLKIASGARA